MAASPSLLAYRERYKFAYIYYRGAYPSTKQHGWIMSRVSKALVKDPFMDEDDLLDLVDDLVAEAPSKRKKKRKKK